MNVHWLDDLDGLIMEGDILEALGAVDDESIEAIVTDAPYELAFMGKSWDDQGVSFRPMTWEACLRVLKPGGHMVVLGGTRTHHRMWCAVEDAGFEVRDTMLWLYGQGMPKSSNIEKALQQWKGWGTGLKPAVELILLARKPLSEPTVVANVLKHGTGALNIDATRIDYIDEADRASATPQGRVTSKKPGAIGAEPDAERDVKRVEFARPDQQGRWPANVVLECTCDNPRPLPEKVRERQGEPSQERRYTEEGATNLAAKPGMRREGDGLVHQSDCPAGMLDSESSGASRFFYCSKANKKERGSGNTHPTVKPLALMRWLVRMVTPPDGIVLDPFCGSGSTLIAATEEGFGFIGVDISKEYVEIAQRRLKGRNT